MLVSSVSILTGANKDTVGSHLFCEDNVFELRGS